MAGKLQRPLASQNLRDVFDPGRNTTFLSADWRQDNAPAWVALLVTVLLAGTALVVELLAATVPDRLPARWPPFLLPGVVVLAGGVIAWTEKRVAQARTRPEWELQNFGMGHDGLYAQPPTGEALAQIREDQAGRPDEG